MRRAETAFDLTRHRSDLSQLISRDLAFGRHLEDEFDIRGPRFYQLQRPEEPPKL